MLHGWDGVLGILLPNMKSGFYTTKLKMLFYFLVLVQCLGKTACVAAILLCYHEAEPSSFLVIIDTQTRPSTEPQFEEDRH